MSVLPERSSLRELLLAIVLLALAPPAVTAQEAPPAAGPDAIGPLRAGPIRPAAYAEPRREACRSRAAGRDGVVAQARVCDGPRRVPIASGADRRRAAALGLGRRPAADRLRIGRPRPEWLAAISSAPREDLLWPVARGLFSRGFGRVRRAEINHRPHEGLDIVAEPGAHIRAANDGLVVYADNGVRGYGNFLVLLHSDGTATFYAHCQAIYVPAGALVRRGQVVGEVGATGLPVVAHLHFEWRRNGVARDPLPALVERPASRDIRPDSETRFAPPPPNVQRPVEVEVSPAPGAIPSPGLSGDHPELHGDAGPPQRRSAVDLEQVRLAFVAMGEGAAEFFDLISLGRARVWGAQVRQILLLRERYRTDELDQALAHAAAYGALSHAAVERILAARCVPRSLDEYVAEHTAKQLKLLLGRSQTEPRDLTESDGSTAAVCSRARRSRRSTGTFSPGSTRILSSSSRDSTSCVAARTSSSPE